MDNHFDDNIDDLRQAFDDNIDDLRQAFDDNIDDLRQEFEEYKNTYMQQLNRSAKFLMTEEELSFYKSEVSEIMPLELKLSNNHYRLMKFWEIEGTNLTQDPLFVMDKVLSHGAFKINPEEQVKKWRKNYISKFHENSGKILDLNTQIEQLEKTKKGFSDHYGLSLNDLPFHPKESKTTNPLNSLIYEMLKNKK